MPLWKTLACFSVYIDSCLSLFEFLYFYWNQIHSFVFLIFTVFNCIIGITCGSTWIRFVWIDKLRSIDRERPYRNSLRCEGAKRATEGVGNFATWGLHFSTENWGLKIVIDTFSCSTNVAVWINRLIGIQYMDITKSYRRHVARRIGRYCQKGVWKIVPLKMQQKLDANKNWFNSWRITSSFGLF